ncbi:hypothetical protein [Gorillibacterium sp. sgz5001074]|uniref:hypothetical protein n=1 Tax=Gorillibacterium sp. sgz5001074 TaxID=3446695 RepID=UPI003F680139
MKEINFQNKRLLFPTRSEWEEIFDNKISEIFGYKLLNAELAKGFISHYLDDFGTQGTKTIAVLEKVPWKEGQWWPRILYCFNGLTLENERLCTLVSNDNLIYVYYRRFHCFDCNLDIDAFCFDRDAYIFNKEELKAAYKNLITKNECPKCKGSVRNPGLIEIIKTF